MSRDDLYEIEQFNLAFEAWKSSTALPDDEKTEINFIKGCLSVLMMEMKSSYVKQRDEFAKIITEFEGD